MEEEILFWSRLNTAVAGFCCQAAIEDDPLQSLVSAMVGDDLEWCGPMAMSFVARKMIETQGQCTELSSRCKFLENSLSNELVAVANLRNKLKQTQSQSTDNEWRLQEQLAQLNSLLAKERSQVEQLERELAGQQKPALQVQPSDEKDSFTIFQDDNNGVLIQTQKESNSMKDTKVLQFSGKENLGAVVTSKRKSLGKIDPNNVIRNYSSLDL